MTKTTRQERDPQTPYRTRLFIPPADVSVIRWLNGQDNVSASLRLLIRDSIERDGYVDVVNRPVEQQPRRGRPVGTGGTEAVLEPAADAPVGSVAPQTGRVSSGIPEQDRGSFEAAPATPEPVPALPQPVPALPAQDLQASPAAAERPEPEPESFVDEPLVSAPPSSPRSAGSPPPSGLNAFLTH